MPLQEANQALGLRQVGEQGDADRDRQVKILAKFHGCDAAAGLCLTPRVTVFRSQDLTVKTTVSAATS